MAFGLGADTSFEGSHGRRDVRKPRSAHGDPAGWWPARAARRGLRCQRARRARRRPARRNGARARRRARARPWPGAPDAARFAQALVDEGIASSEGIARILAARYQLPLVDLATADLDESAAQLIPAARARARHGDPVRPRRRHAPGRDRRSREHARHRRAAAGDAPPGRARRRVAGTTSWTPSGASAAPARRSATVSRSRTTSSSRPSTEDQTDLELDDGVSDVPLVRLVNSVLFQAAEDGASDVHFEPQEDVAARPVPRSTASSRRCSGSPSGSLPG